VSLPAGQAPQPSCWRPCDAPHLVVPRDPCPAPPPPTRRGIFPRREAFTGRARP